jgi:hypothetical protein
LKSIGVFLALLPLDLPDPFGYEAMTQSELPNPGFAIAWAAI